MRKFSKLEDMVIKFFAGICSTAKEYMFLGEHRNFAACNECSEMLDAAEENNVLTSVSEMPGPKFDMSGSGEVKAAAEFIKDERTALLANMKAIARKVLQGLDLTQVLLRPILQLISSMIESYLLYKMCHHLLSNMWSLVWRSKSYSTDAKACLARGWGPLGVPIRRSKMDCLLVVTLERKMWWGRSTGRYHVRTAKRSSEQR